MASSKIKTTGLQKFFLILLGLLLTELILHLMGWSYNFLQQQQNESGLANTTNAKLILCIGESTTAWGLSNSYPAILQKKLNQTYGEGKYKVLNQGLAGSNTEIIADTLPDLVSQYSPKVVVTMMGINDPWTLEGEKSFLKYSKLYKLFEIIKYNLQGRLERKRQDNDVLEWKQQQDRFILSLPSDWGGEVAKKFLNSLKNQDYESSVRFADQLLLMQNAPDNLFFDAAQAFLKNGNSDLAEKYFSEYLKRKPTADEKLRVAKLYLFFLGIPDKEAQQKVLKLSNEVLKNDSKNEEALGLVGCVLAYQKDATGEAQSDLEKAIQYGNRDGNILLVLAGLYQKNNLMDAAEKTLELGLDDHEVGVYVWAEYVRTLYWKENWEKAERSVDEALKRYPSNQNLLDLKALVLKAQGKRIEADTKNTSYWKQHFLLNEQTQKNYLRVANFLKKSGVLHVAMQYPVREIDELKALLKDYPEVIFVENRTNFLEAEKKHKFEELFNDKFADNFGHLSPLGAEYVADELISTLQKKSVLPQPNNSN